MARYDAVPNHLFTELQRERMHAVSCMWARGEIEIDYAYELILCIMREPVPCDARIKFSSFSASLPNGEKTRA